MEIRVKLFATFREKAPTKVAIGEAFHLKVKDDCVVLDLLDHLDIPVEEAKIVMVNGISIKDYNHKLKQADLVACFPPIGGG